MPEPPTQPNTPLTALPVRLQPPLATRPPAARTVSTPTLLEPRSVFAPPKGVGLDYAIWALLGIGLFLFWVLVGYLIPGFFGK
jgi:hypothetical protein